MNKFVASHKIYTSWLIQNISNYEFPRNTEYSVFERCTFFCISLFLCKACFKMYLKCYNYVCVLLYVCVTSDHVSVISAFQLCVNDKLSALQKCIPNTRCCWAQQFTSQSLHASKHTPDFLRNSNRRQGRWIVQNTTLCRKKGFFKHTEKGFFNTCFVFSCVFSLHRRYFSEFLCQFVCLYIVILPCCNGYLCICVATQPHFA